MRKNITILSLFLLSNLGFSQIRYADQNIIAIGGGFTGKKGFYAQFSYSKLIGNKGWLGRGDFFYLHQKAHIKNISEDKEVNLTQYLVMPMAQYDFENLNIDPFVLSVFGGAVGGYEIVNNGNNTLPNSGISSPKLKNNFIYGISLGVQGEVEIKRGIAVYSSIMEMYRLNSSIGNFSFLIGAGLKFYL